MIDKYLEYTLEELIDDPDFIAWALHSANSKEWETWLSNNQDFVNKVNSAKEIISLLRNISEKKLVEEDKLIIWKRIELYDKQKKKSSLKISLIKTLRYAAVFLLLTIVGVTAYKHFHKPVKGYEFLSDHSSFTEEEAKLVLPSGEEVKLKKDNSSIVVSDDQKIIVDDEVLIDISEQKHVDEVIKMNEVIIPYGKKSQIVLDDGTKVWLNAGSRLAFPSRFTGKIREVFLEGEAYFEVEEVPGQLFLVNAGDITAKVLGTRFDISAYAEDSEVTAVLLEGCIALSDNLSKALVKKETILESGQKASFNKDIRTVAVNMEKDAAFYIAWTEGWFRFYQENLTTVLKKLERYYKIETEFSSPYDSNDLITGKLDLKDSIEDVMKVLADVAEIEYQIKGNKIIIYPQKNKKSY